MIHLALWIASALFLLVVGGFVVQQIHSTAWWIAWAFRRDAPAAQERRDDGPSSET